MFVSFKIAAAALTSITLIGSAGVASAQDFQSNGRTSGAYHGDLDLSKSSDQAKLRTRVSLAASRVCASQDLAAKTACKKLAIAHVQAPVNAAIARADTSERYADADRAQRRALADN